MHKTVFKSFIVSVILVTLASGCTTTVVELHPTTVEFPKVTRLPMTLGIFYGPKLREDKFLPRVLFLGAPIEARLGAASIDLFDRVFPLVAEETTQVARLPVPQGSPRVAAIIELAIDDYEVGIGFSWSPVLHWVELTYRFNLWSSDGKLLFSWTVTGVGLKQEGQSTIEFSQDPYVTAIELAMEDAAMKLLETFQGLPEVRQLPREDKNRASP